MSESYDLTRTLILVRHGETASNHGNASGCDQDLGLTPRGRQQARLLGERLAESYAAYRIVSSPQRRAMETARELGRCRPGLETRQDDRLRELRWPGLHDRPWHEQERADVVAAGMDWIPEGGESLRERRRAVEGFLMAWIGESSGIGDEPVGVAVTHGMAIRLLLQSVMGFDLAFVRTRIVLHNGGMTTLLHNRRRGLLLAGLNDTAHLGLS